MLIGMEKQEEKKKEEKEDLRFLGLSGWLSTALRWINLT